MRNIIRFVSVCSALMSLGLLAHSQQNVSLISVDALHPGATISSSMFGIFFEDINFGADGGLYPELVKNRSFEFQEPAHRLARGPWY